MVKIELNNREVYLVYLAIRNQLAALMQYPDPLHEQHKAEYSQLNAVFEEAVSQARDTKSSKGG